MRRVVQTAIIKVVRPQVVEYTCDWCGEVCGTRANPKQTWTSSGRADRHYCKRSQCVKLMRMSRCYRCGLLFLPDDKFIQYSDSGLRGCADIGACNDRRPEGRELR